ncbi:MAG TPA: VOC family protein, partial [Caulobacteraceae bacterium]
DIGNGDCLAFFWFPNAPAAQPGVSNPGGLPGHPDFVTAHASMNHVAFSVPVEKFDEYYDKLKAKGIEVSPILNHDNSKYQVSATVHEGVFVRSVYFFDPDGVCLEFACWTRAFTEADVEHEPMTAEGMRARLVAEPAE